VQPLINEDAVTNDLSERRLVKARLKSNYQSGVTAILDRVVADWQRVWVEDCRQKGHTIPFGEWCFIPLIEGDPTSSPFEIANVYVR
jgi:hypothetical protein